MRKYVISLSHYFYKGYCNGFGIDDLSLLCIKTYQIKKENKFHIKGSVISNTMDYNTE